MYCFDPVIFDADPEQSHGSQTIECQSTKGWIEVVNLIVGLIEL